MSKVSVTPPILRSFGNIPTYLLRRRISGGKWQKSLEQKKINDRSRSTAPAEGSQSHNAIVGRFSRGGSLRSPSGRYAVSGTRIFEADRATDSDRHGRRTQSERLHGRPRLQRDQAAAMGHCLS